MVAYFCLHELHLLPSAYQALPRRERAFICAAIEVRAEKQKELENKLNRR